MMSICRTWPANQAFRQGQKQRRSTRWKGVRRDPFRTVQNFIQEKIDNWGSTNTTISGCCQKKLGRESLWINPRRFSLVHLNFHLLRCFSIFYFQTFFLWHLLGRFFSPFPWTSQAFQGSLGPHSFAGYLRCVSRSGNWIPWRNN